MSTFDNFFTKAESFAKTAAAATRHAADSAKLSIAIAAEEDKVKRAYAALGKLCFRALDDRSVPQGPAVEEQMELIRQGLAKIAQLRSQKAAETAGKSAPEQYDQPEEAPLPVPVAADSEFEIIID